jgi:hypothetical protein
MKNQKHQLALFGLQTRSGYRIEVEGQARTKKSGLLAALV